MVAKLRGIVVARGGSFDELAYVNKRTPVQFRCAEGHVWTVQPQTVLTGSWCKQCWKQNEAGKHLVKDGLTEARRIAQARGGECLSTAYANGRQRLQWRCRNGHDWLAPLADVRRRGWCPVCGSGARERLCRYYFEALTSHRFPKARPTWLVNERGNRMELDGYNEKLKLAFEHQGEQHYRPVAHFNRRGETLLRRQRDDERKLQLSEQRGITLVAVPFSVPTSELDVWIKCAIGAARPDIELLQNINSTEYVSGDEILQLKAVAGKRGGDCISPVYLGVTEKHWFRCAEGHEWEAIASGVKSGTWCPICKLKTLADKRRVHSVESMQKLAQTRGGSFVSERFSSVNHKHRWRCVKGHEWDADPADVFKGNWCRICHIESRRGTLDQARRVAQSRGGECLSLEYRSSQSKLTWKCSEGHEWSACLGNVKNSGSWCPQCARQRMKKQPGC
ncbi:zinc-ribbon domain-containing protein [Paraburkholderia antibiotica]|uniref:Zinc-ribbon domain-containing protein n=1 Tax=Paraburkholderia antibiotica TaxID=2728839 RepID=A0A7Y0A2S0_9BURK|nr:zinc-ribbon domain-containing protein [Paraburkholderia antibiotica]NML35452.1 zinc-ribbon domain-containing protein [Paraburkholderia antibiotica]